MPRVPFVLRSTEVHPDCDEFATLKKNRETWFQEQKRLQISATSFFFPIEPSGVLFFLHFLTFGFSSFSQIHPFPCFCSLLFCLSFFPFCLFSLFPCFLVSLFPCCLLVFMFFFFVHLFVFWSYCFFLCFSFLFFH